MFTWLFIRGPFRCPFGVDVGSSQAQSSGPSGIPSPSGYLCRSVFSIRGSIRESRSGFHRGVLHRQYMYNLTINPNPKQIQRCAMPSQPTDFVGT